MNTLKTARPDAKTRLPYIDLLECIAIFSVLSYHGTQYDSNFLNGGTAAQYFRYIFSMIQSSCVPLFLLVNGYLLFSRPLDLKKHIKKTVRLTLVTVVWLLLLLLIMQPINQQYLNWEALSTMFWELQMGWNNHLWYMGTLVGLYIFFPLLKWAFDTNRKVFYYFTAISAIMTFGNTLINQFLTVFNYIVLNKVEVYYNFNFFHIFNPFHSGISYPFVYFCVGGILFSLQEKIEAIPLVRRNAAAVVVLLVSWLLLGVLNIGYSILCKNWLDGVYLSYDTVFTFCITICLFLLSLNWKKDVALIRVISCNTLGIYFVHNVFHRILLPYAVMIPQLRTIPGTMLYASVLLLICLVFCLIVKKIPVLNKLI